MLDDTEMFAASGPPSSANLSFCAASENSNIGARPETRRVLRRRYRISHLYLHLQSGPSAVYLTAMEAAEYGKMVPVRTPGSSSSVALRLQHGCRPPEAQKKIWPSESLSLS